MNRKLLRAVTVALLTVPGSAAALGLGPIQVKSALDQPLLAEIPILAARPAELDQLRADIASSDLFERLGLEHPPALSGLNLRIEGADGGNPHIVVTSRSAMREPLLNLVVDVRWPGGRLVRDFAVLLDPPNLVRRAQPSRARVAAVAPPRPSPTASPAFSGDSYRVASGDTLWAIASRTRPDASVSVQQMLMALYRANPGAFYAPNINSLNAGATLRMPPREELLALSREQAAAEVQQQPHTPTAATATAAPPAAASEPAELAAAGAAPPTLRLVEAEGPAQPSGDATAAVPEISLPGTGEGAGEPLIRLENGGVGLRLVGLDQLEQRLPTLVGIEDPVLATRQVRESLESAVATADAAAPQADAAAATAGEEVPGSAAPEPAQAAAPATSSPEVEAGEPSGAEVALAAASAAEDAAAAAEEQPPAALPSEAATSAAAEQSPTREAAATEPSAPAAELGILERATGWLQAARAKLLADPRQLAIVGGGALLLLLLALALARRGGKREPLSRAMPAAMPARAAAPMAPPERSAEPSPPAATELLPAAAAAPVAAVATRERVDNLRHADFLIAMGQYEDAAELVRGALQEEPERQVLRVKLLECLRAAGDQEAFLREAEVAREPLQAAGCWPQVQELAVGFVEYSPMFSHASAQRHTTRPTDALPEDAVVAREPAETNEEAALELTPADEDLDRSIEAELRKLDAEGLGDARDVDVLSFDDFRWEEPSGGAGASAADLSSRRARAAEDALDRADDGLEEEQSFVDTKLDLARAYLEMGDGAGARTLFEEVLEEGNEGQRETAKLALVRLG